MSKSGRVWLGGPLRCLAAIPARIQLAASSPRVLLNFPLDAPHLNRVFVLGEIRAFT